MDKFAAVDLGTNTFHLLVASFNEDGSLEEHYRQRNYVHLAMEGIDTIADEAYTKAVECIREFTAALNNFKIKSVACSGTAALRTASNGPQLVEEIEEIAGFKVDVIDGITEAKYIFEGVSLAVPQLKDNNHIIMDIGGGSVEFIVIKNGHFYWSNSYPIGIAVLRKNFHRSEPISSDEIHLVNQFVRDEIGKLLYLCRGIHFDSLVGASGSFEVIANMQNQDEKSLYTDISIDDFEQVYESIIVLNLEERLARKDIPNDRASLIVVAFQLMHYLLTQIQCDKIIVSKYAMKEGMLTTLKK